MAVRVRGRSRHRRANDLTERPQLRCHRRHAKEFFYPSRGIHLWAPLSMRPAIFVELRRPHFLMVIARLRPGVSIEQARAEMNTIASGLEKEYPDTNARMGVGVGPMREWMVGDTRLALLLLIGAVGFLLLIVCANVANLQLGRVAGRVREMSIRTALGATRAQLHASIVGRGSGVVSGRGRAGTRSGLWDA